MQRPLQWVICLLHINELPLRAFVKTLDGETGGPQIFVGPLGKLLSKAKAMPIMEFDAIPSEPLSALPNELSTDRKYLYRMHEAVSSRSV